MRPWLIAACLVASLAAATVLADNPVEVKSPASGYAYFTGESRGFYKTTPLETKLLEYVVSNVYPTIAFPSSKNVVEGVARYAEFASDLGDFEYEFNGLELIEGFVYAKIHSEQGTILPLESLLDLTLRLPDEFLPHVMERFPENDRDEVELRLRRIQLGRESVRDYVRRHVRRTRGELAFGDLMDALREQALNDPDAETERSLVALADAIDNSQVQAVMMLARFPFIVVNQTSGGADGTEVVAYVQDGDDDNHKNVYYMYAHGTEQVPIRYRHVDDPDTWTTKALVECNTFRKLEMVAEGDQWYVEKISKPRPVSELVDDAEQAWLQAKATAAASDMVTNTCP